MFSLGDQKQSPEATHRLLIRGVPRNVLLVTCGLISITVILNLIIPNAEPVFVYITSVATSITVVGWPFIVVAYLSYYRKDHALPKASPFKFPGGVFSAFAVPPFLPFILVLFLLDPAPRFAFFFFPICFVSPPFFFL
ncbi:amino acid permease, partial [Staphylococcus hyicus]